MELWGVPRCQPGERERFHPRGHTTPGTAADAGTHVLYTREEHVRTLHTRFYAHYARAPMYAPHTEEVQGFESHERKIQTEVICVGGYTSG